MAFTGQLATPDSRLANLEPGGPVAPAAPPRQPRLIAEINWDDLPTLEFPPVGYTDISNRVRAFTVRRGRNNFVDRVEAGTATLLLDNRDGYFNFTQPGRLLMRKMRLTAFYDQTRFPLLVGHVEAYRYSYPGTDRDAVVELTVADGMKVLAQQSYPLTYVRENEAPAARVADALSTAGIGSSYQNILNTASAHLAPVRVTQPEPAPTQNVAATLTHLSSTITVADTSGIRPGDPIVAPGIPVGNVVNQVTGPTSFTIANPTQPGFGQAYLTRTKDTQYPGNPGPWYEIGAISETRDLSVGMAVGDYFNINSAKLFDKTVHFLTEIREGSVSVGAAITQTWRGPTDAGGIATAVPFSAPSAATIVMERRYLQVTGVLDHIRQVEATERGTFLILGDGTYQYQGAGYRPAQTVQMIFGENPGEVPYMEAPVFYDDANVTNDYQLHNVYNDTVTTVSDATSQSRYFKRTEQIDQIWYGNGVSLPTDQRVFEPIPRMEGLRAQTAADPATLWRKVLTLGVSSKVSVRRRPMYSTTSTSNVTYGSGVYGSDPYGVGGSGAVDILAGYDQYVEGIQHDATPSAWNVTFTTSPVRS